MPGYQTAKQRAVVLRNILLDNGVPEVSIELQVGRPSGWDDWNACNPVGVMSHHIASRPTVYSPTPGLALVKRGRSDLPGPLCNGTAGVDLVYRIICMGYANHPGFGGPLVLRGPAGAYSIPEDNARPYIWGTEYEGGYDNATWDRVYTNKRTGMSMTFREFMGRCNAGLVQGIWNINGRGKNVSPLTDLSGYHLEHKTWAPGRKPDRHDYTTESGRAEIRKYKESGMAEYKDWSKESKDALVSDILGQKVKVRKNVKGERESITIKQAIARSANTPVLVKQSEAEVLKAIAESDADNQ